MSTKRRRGRNAPGNPVALVTGGAHRIGRQIALALARDGFDVAVHYGRSRDGALATVADVRKAGRQACAVRRDLAVARSLASMLEECATSLGEVTCLVNSASMFEADGALDFEPARLARHMGVNVAAPILLASQLHARIAKGGQGVVINVLDQKLWNPNPDFLSYTLSKAALCSATGLLARALAPKLRVVGLAPGITLPAAGQSRRNFDRVSRLTPLGYSSSPEDIAQAVVYLARARAVTGTTLLVDGGQHLVPSERDVMFLRGAR
ncbi:MAG TPA: SDR family oxidoreductase [Burkholderiaceae bacterium]|jgi:NAD(P)-dependent dehydrogenase (short-subunit alcohol dehydrogenase family)|nr:SDR family oxidoreductase [Burkholderiaceae bacterium]